MGRPGLIRHLFCACLVLLRLGGNDADEMPAKVNRSRLVPYAAGTVRDCLQAYPLPEAPSSGLAASSRQLGGPPCLTLLS
jgi:hypothetical protein